MILSRPWAAGLTVGLSIVLAACGHTSNQELAAAREAGRSQGAAEQKAEAEKQQLEQDVANLRAQQEQLAKKMTAAAASPKVEREGTSNSGTQDCGGGVSVNSVTSCSFAQVVAQQWRNYGGDTSTFEAWSPTTQRYYTMRCVSGLPTVCRGGNNAAVYIR
jgi:hypothetical protein